MTIDAGAWKYGKHQFLNTGGLAAASAASIADALSSIAAILTSSGQGWSVQRAAVSGNAYTAGGSTANNFVVLQHSSGARYIVSIAPPGSGVLPNAVMDNNTSANHTIAVAYLPVGATGYTGNPSSASFFDDSRAFRFSPLIQNINTLAPIDFRVCVQNTNIWMAVSYSTDSPSSYHGIVLTGSEIVEQLVEAGDTHSHAQIRWGGAGGGTLVSSSIATHAQTWNAAGDARRGIPASPYTTSQDSTLVAVATQAGGPYFGTTPFLLRSNADVSTQGIVTGRGIKGRLAVNAVSVVPPNVVNRARLGTGGGQFVHLVAGLSLGWDSTFGAMT